jgi:hypothetical protein
VLVAVIVSLVAAGAAEPAATAVAATSKPARPAAARAAPATAASWKIQAAPYPNLANGTLSSVACASAKDCLAVGEAVTTSGSVQSISALWNGTTWTQKTTPDPASALSSSLSGVSCVSATDCFAVGTYANSTTSLTLIELWNGTTWAIKSTPNPAGASASLAAVSCFSSTSCNAVGSQTSSSSGLGTTLAETLKGTTWTLVASANGKNITNSLVSLSCKSSASCVAVGDVDTSSFANNSLAETFNGTSWTLSNAVTPAGDNAILTGVACTSTSSCVAVGSFGQFEAEGMALIESWNGKTWTQETAPGGASTTYDLAAIACSAAAACIAVGGAGDFASTLAMSWNGKAWSVVVTPDPAGTGTSLSGVTCSAATSCISVGGDTDSVGEHVSFAESLSGTAWALTAATPNPQGRPANSLLGVSCSSATACTSVGQRADITLGESWNGTSWAIISTPDATGSPGDVLNGVACRSSALCMAVGAGNTSLSYTGLAEEWTRTSWAVKPVPEPSGTTVALLSGVACATTTACVAVGFFQNSAGVDLPLAESWNGTIWKAESPPAPSGAEESALESVACVSATSCMAVGNYDNSDFDTLPLAESWNGTTWAIKSTPNPSGSTDTLLTGVACSGSTCTAVGNAVNSSFVTVTLAESWNGTAWAIKATPEPKGATSGVLSAVTCTSSTSCAAVGNYDSSSFFTLTLAESWNGTTWTVVASPNPAGAEPDALSAVSCSTATACTAVGTTGSDLLVERYST